MTTPRQAPGARRSEARTPVVVHPESGLGAIIPGPAAAPDRETLGRVLDALRDLPEQPTPGPNPAAEPESAGGAVPTVPLPRRRRSERRAPSVD